MNGYTLCSPVDLSAAYDESSLVETLLGDEQWRSPEPLNDLLEGDVLPAGKATILAGAQDKGEAGACREPSDRMVPCEPIGQAVKVEEEQHSEFNVFDLDSALFGGTEFGLDFGEDLFAQPDSLDGVVPILEPAYSSSSSVELTAAGPRDALSASSELASFAYRPTAAHTSVFMPTAPEAVHACVGSPATAARQIAMARGDAWGAGGEAATGGDAPLDRHARVMRYREKRKRRTFEKTIRYQSRKAYAEVRPRIKGRFATKEEVAAMKAAAAAGLPTPVFA